MSMQYTAIFHGCKNGNFRTKKFDIFPIVAQNIDRGCALEPPQCGRSTAVLTSTHELCFSEIKEEKQYTRINPSFTI